MKSQSKPILGQFDKTFVLLNSNEGPLNKRPESSERYEILVRQFMVRYTIVLLRISDFR
jgi:hypothetical protein